MSDPSARNRLLGLLVLLMGAVIVAPRLRSAGGEPERGTCPPEFPQTRMAATLLWNAPDAGYGAREPTAVDGHRPDDLRLLVTETDAEACARIRAALPDSLKPLGLLAPRFAAFYEVGELYVVPVEPSISPEEIDAEVRGGRMIEKTGITFVFDRRMNVLAAVEN